MERQDRKKEISIDISFVDRRRCNYIKDNKRDNSENRVNALRYDEGLFYKRNVMVACEPSVYLWLRAVKHSYGSI